MTNWKVLCKAVIRISATVSVVLGSFYYIAGTQAGLNLVWSGVERLLPDKIHVGSLQGTLMSTLAVKDFSYVDEDVSVSIHAMAVNADLISLIGHRLVIRDLQLDGLRVNVKLPKPSTTDQSAPFDPSQLVSLISSITMDQAVIHDAEITIAEAVIRFNGTLNTAWQMEWSATIPDFSHVLNGLHSRLVTNGRVSGSRYQPVLQTSFTLDKFASGVVSIQSLQGNLRTQYQNYLMSDGKLRVQGLNIDDFLVPDFNLQTTGQLRGDKLTQQAVVTLSPVNKINADIIFPALKKVDGINQVFKASAKVDVKDFSQFKTLFIDVPQVRQLTGRVTGGFTGRGSLLHPVFEGGLQASQGSVYIPAASTTLTDIQLTTRYRTGEAVKLGGTFTAGSGTLALSGTYGIEEAALPLKLTVRGADILVKDTKEYTIKISPEILLDYRNNDLAIDGKILVPLAQVQPLDFGGTATLPNDVVIVNRQSASASVPTNLSLHLQVILGDRVKIKYRGLEAKLKGAITILSEDGNPFTATGEFGIAKDGTYRAYGRSLVIQQGRLIYTGNLLTNPGISLRATQTIKKVGFSGSSQFEESNFKPVYAGADSLVVGIEANGTLDKPRISLFSDPAGLSQGDILSYLLLGYPQAQAKGTSSLALLNVVTEMYGNGDKKNVVNHLQESLGLDELSVGTTEYYDANNTGVTNSATHNTTTVNLGRNLGRNLSVHYSVGIFQQIQVFSLRYQINRHLAVQTETSTLENGGDLLYQLESRD